jgi:hypothetical protein
MHPFKLGLACQPSTCSDILEKTENVMLEKIISFTMYKIKCSTNLTRFRTSLSQPKDLRDILDNLQSKANFGSNLG